MACVPVWSSEYMYGSGEIVGIAAAPVALNCGCNLATDLVTVETAVVSQPAALVDGVVLAINEASPVIAWTVAILPMPARLTRL